MRPPFFSLRAAAIAGALVIGSLGSASAQRGADAGTRADTDADEESDDGSEDDVWYPDGEESEESEDAEDAEDAEVDPGDASISGGGLGCSLASAGAQGAVAPLLVLAGLWLPRRRRR